MNGPSSLIQWHALCDKWSRAGYAALSPSEKLWLNIRSLIDSIQNGGLISYYYNSGADRLPDCMMALDLLEARDVRCEVERLSLLFGEPVPSTMTARNAIISSWKDDDPRLDALLTDINKKLMPMLDLLETKLEKHLRHSGLIS